ncbi:MAG: hypothetical protein NC203_04955 [Firmicutes bacterium]|nr:hypothetical protein [[Eubacterium] siraeum]MCM1487699.1 hypothetical protein [Bacillota bacterium]
MAFQSIVVMLLAAMMIFFVIVVVLSISGILGIVLGCISADKSGKYVTMRGNTDFKQVKSYSTAAKVFFIINCIFLGIAAALVIFASFGLNTQDFEYGSKHDEYGQLDGVTSASLIIDFISSAALPIGSIVAGAISVKKFKAAKELKEELDSKGLRSYPLPQNPYYQNQYYYNGQYPNNRYYRQYPNQSYYRYPNQYQYPVQNQYYVQGYGQNRSYTQNQPDNRAANVNTDQTSFTAEKIKCPSCGTENSSVNSFCVNCGGKLK